jgi:hypothetical protein
VLGGIPSSAQGTYTFPDKNPATGQNLYRLKQNDINDNATYSKVVQVLYSDLNNNLGKGSINVYPNPANNIINLTISPSYDVKATNYNIRVTNSTGMVVKEVTSAQPQWQSSVSNLLIGTYFIEVVNNKDKSLIGKTKFVKL